MEPRKNHKTGSTMYVLVWNSAISSLEDFNHAGESVHVKVLLTTLS